MFGGCKSDVRALPGPEEKPKGGCKDGDSISCLVFLPQALPHHHQVERLVG